MKKILWISRHRPLPAQREELKRLFGSDVQVVLDGRPFDSADDIIERAREFDEVVVVAPLFVIYHLTERGLKPLYAQMEHLPNQQEVWDPDREVVAAGRVYRFTGFKRIMRVVVEFADITPSETPSE